jgi:outer membrane protein OmpA-like peptidoglycan-associated protein/curli biogenesis system outer membrane secretion channel CsgG
MQNRLKTQKLLVVTILILFSFCITVANADDTVTYQGNKARITVGKIKTKASKCPWDLAEAIGEMISTSLANNEKFIVLASQEEVEELAEEIDMAQSGYIEEGRGPEKGLMEGADILITGAVTAFEPDAGGSGGGLGGLKKKAFGKVGIDKKNAEVQLDIKIIDIRTRRIIKAKSIKAKSSKWKASMTGGGWVEDVALAGGLGVYSNQPMENAIRGALARILEMITKEVPDEYYRYKGQGQYTKEYGSQGGSSDEQTSTSSNESGSLSPASPAEDMTLYTKYDFVPGNKVIFFDDMKDEEEGEFPYRWNLDKGVYEVVRLGKEYWIMCSGKGSVRPKIADAPLPPKYTVELEIYDNGPDYRGAYYYIHWVNSQGKSLGYLSIKNSDLTNLRILKKDVANKKLPEKLSKGVHTMRVMATKRSIKCYIDNERVANVPKVEGFDPVGFRIETDPWDKPENPMLFRGFRFAEGGKSMRQQLDDDGKIVTHGILFDSGSDKIKGESFRTLKEIGRLFEDDPDLRLSIEGHTDSDGSEQSNQSLSQNRANAVRDFLITTYSISTDRLESKGWGESKPTDTNDSPEGKANNRRVELIQL